MKAIVLVGGLGLRLRPLTETVPKPLLPLVDRPLLDHLVDHLAAHDIDEVLLSSPEHEEAFRRYAASRSGRPRVRLLPEPTPLGTAGALANAVRAAGLKESFVALNGDTPTDVDVTQLVHLHRARGAVATLALTRVEDAQPFGLVACDPQGNIVAFRENPEWPTSGLISAGAYVVRPESLRAIDPGEPASVERDVFPALITSGERVIGRISSAYWIDVGTPGRYLTAIRDALQGRGPCRVASAPSVHVSARVSPGARVGQSVVLAADVVVEDGARVTESVLMRGATVGVGARVSRSILAPRACIGARADVLGCVLGESAMVADGGVERDARIGRGDTSRSSRHST